MHKNTPVFRLLSALLLVLPLALGACAAEEPAEPPAGPAKDAQRLIAAYPEAAMRLIEEDGALYIGLAAERLLFSPAGGCPASDPEALTDQPLCAMFGQAYPMGPGGRYPAAGFEPGRVRNEALLKLLYGASSAEVEQQLAAVDFLGQERLFNRRQGAASALARVAARLEALSRENPSLLDYIHPTEETYFWRVILSSKRISAHSFGIAIDLNIQRGPYWQWMERDDPEVLDAQANYPQAIIDAFEAEGFIWGGKWHSYDFMHFEYRPEMTGRR